MPDIGSVKYKDAFERLTTKGVKQHPTSRVYYALLRWGSESIRTDQYLDIALMAGLWSDTLKNCNPAYKIRMLWHNWSASKKNMVLNEIEYARHEVSGKAGKNKAWVFFMGEQDAKDRSLFTVHDPRKFCCLVDEIKYP